MDFKAPRQFSQVSGMANCSYLLTLFYRTHGIIGRCIENIVVIIYQNCTNKHHPLVNVFCSGNSGARHYLSSSSDTTIAILFLDYPGATEWATVHLLYAHAIFYTKYHVAYIAETDAFYDAIVRHQEVHAVRPRATRGYVYHVIVLLWLDF